MELTVFSHKPCWLSAAASSTYATDGGFPFQMRALSELFSGTRLVVPCARSGKRIGETALSGRMLAVVPLTTPRGRGIGRRLALPVWILRNGATLLRETLRAEAVHAVIPGDIGTLGMLLAWALRKRLLVRHCGNWLVQRTMAERFWRWFIERFAGGRNVMLVTGSGPYGPSRRNEHVHWIFSTSMSAAELAASASVRHSLPQDGPRIVTVARLDPKKGTGVAIRSLPLLVDAYPGVQLHVVGDGPGLAGLRHLAAQLGVASRVFFHGQVGHDEVLRQLRAADLFCLPSASEGFPKAVLEALACGVPVITTRVSGLPHLLRAGCGALLKEASPTAVAEAVLTCLEDRARYRTMSERAVNTARTYSLEHWSEIIGAFLAQAWGPLATDAQPHAASQA